MAGGAQRVRENLGIVAGLEKAMVRNLPDPRVRASHDAGDSSQGLEAVAEKLDGFRGGAGLPRGPSPAFGWRPTALKMTALDSCQAGGCHGTV